VARSITGFEAPLAVAALMAGFARPWCIAGGWSLDLFLGRVTRHHKDVEIAIFRDDQRALYDYLAGWDMLKATLPGRAPWHGERLDLPRHEIHAQSTGDPGRIEILLNERDGNLWRFRRNLAIALPVERFVVHSPVGVPAIAPEIALLYKAKQPRPDDDADFAAVLGALDNERRRWLAEAVQMDYPDHPWLAALEQVAGSTGLICAL
jgi:hypothetical protein